MTQPFMPKTEAPSDSRSPLVRFNGVCKEWIAEQIPASEDRRASTRVTFNFTNVEVVEATDPYLFPIATIPIGYSERDGTVWSVFTESFRNVVGGAQPLDVLVGKTQQWYWAPCKLRRPARDGDADFVPGADKQAWELRDAHAWTIVSLEGATGSNGSGPSLNEALAALANGKTDSEFLQALVTAGPEIKALKGYMEAVTAGTNRELLPMLSTSGLITLGPDGKWAKV